jgi:hypothetical protein
MDEKTHNWMKLDEEGHIPSVLDKVARCPYCGRYVVRGLLHFLRHATEDCPHKQTYNYSLGLDDIIEFTQPNKQRT